MRLTQTLKSASFKLTAAYAGLFALSVGLLAAVTYVSVEAELKREFQERIVSESSALAADYQAGGVRQVLRAISDRQRGRLTDGLDFTLLDGNGRHLFGDLPLVACKRGWTTLTGPPDGDEAPGELEQLGVYTTPLPNGLCLLVGDDWGEVANFGTVVLQTFGWVFLLSLTMAIAGGLFLSSRFLKRIEVITKTAEAIIEGDIKRRIPRRGAPDDLDRLAATLNRMLDRTCSLTESLKHLSNDIAHDLRTPLGRLRSLLEPTRVQALQPKEYRAVIDKGVGEIDNILNMFSAILRVAQIESSNRRSGFQRLCLSDLVADICDTFGPAFEEDGRTLRQEVEPDLWIHGDQELITLSVANLLENAASHTPLHSQIAVFLRKARGGVELDVSDDGPGVPQSERERIFQRFYRLETSRTTAGNGLGLSIVAAVADLHTASVIAEDNQPGLRVAIHFLLPDLRLRITGNISKKANCRNVAGASGCYGLHIEKFRAEKRLMPLRLLSAILVAAAIALPAHAEELDLGAYKGKVVYLDFWASWCVPCRLSFPWMNQLQQIYASKGVVVIAVDVDRDRAHADEFLGQMPHAFRIVYDPSGHIAQQFNFKDMPTSVLVGRDGKPHFIHSGFFPAQEGEYLAHLDSLIGGGE